MKNIELKTLREEDFNKLTKLHIEFCSPNSKISKQKYKDFVNEVNRISSEGYEVGIFGEYVETYKELKECCGGCKK